MKILSDLSIWWYIHLKKYIIILSVLMILALYLFGIGWKQNLAVSHTATTPQLSEKRFEKE